MVNAAVTPDLESYKAFLYARLQRRGFDAHDDGTVSCADVGTACCVRVAEGGEVLDRVDLPQSAFDCVVGDLGWGPTLYVAVNDFTAEPADGPAGKILAVPLT